LTEERRCLASVTAFMPSEREWQVLALLWKRGSATTADVVAWLGDTWEPDIGRTTALNHLRSLRAKRWVACQSDGHAYTYYPAIPLDWARMMELQRVTEILFDCSRETLLDYLVRDQLTSHQTLASLKQTIDERLARPERKPFAHDPPPRAEGRAPPPAPAQRSTSSTMREGKSAER
jgi:predicted transcriptional regulator